MRKLKTLVSALVVALVVITCVDYAASAATGHAFILGQINKANKITTLNRTTSGPAVKLHTTSSAAAPMVVNGHGRVANLNADTVDGLQATSLQTRSTIYRIPSEVGVGSFTMSFTGLPTGLYHISFSVIAKMSVADAKLNCHLVNSDTGFYELMGYGSTYSDYSTSNASGIMDTRGSARQFRCFTSGGTATVDYDYDQQSQIVLTRIDGLATGALVSARPSTARTAPGSIR